MSVVLGCFVTIWSAIKGYIELCVLGGSKGGGLGAKFGLFICSIIAQRFVSGCGFFGGEGAMWCDSHQMMACVVRWQR